MNEDQKNLGAPSSDETSALFVSARKKQLVQQEEERKRKEEEEKRLEEVRKLEEEVRMRKQQAEAESRQIEQEQERARLAQEQGGKVSKLMGKTPLGKPASAQKDEKAAKPNMPSAGKLNPKLLAIIGGGVVIIAVILILVLSGGKGSKASDLFGTNLKSFLDMSAAEQTAFLMECEKFYDDKEYKRIQEKAGTEEDEKARLDTLIKEIKRMATAIEDADIGQAFLEASGLPMMITSWAYEIDDKETIDLLKANIQYKEWSEKELTALNLIDFIKLPGDEAMSALFAAQDWFITNNVVSEQQSQNILEAMISIQGTVAYVANQGGANATRAMSFLAGFGYLSGYAPQMVEQLTQYPYGVFVYAPTIDDPLDAECVITGLGYKAKYPGSTFSIAEIGRNYVRIYPTTNQETADILFGFSEQTIPGNTEDFEEYLSKEAVLWLTALYGSDIDFKDGVVAFQNDPSLPLQLIYTAYFFDQNDKRLDLFIRVAVTNEKPYTTIVAAHPNNMERYLAIADKIRLSMEML